MGSLHLYANCMHLLNQNQHLFSVFEGSNESSMWSKGSMEVLKVQFVYLSLMKLNTS